MRLKFVIFLILVTLPLNVCGKRATEVAPLLTPTDTPIPTPTSTPAPTTPLAMLVVPADMDPAISSVYQTAVYKLAEQSGFRFQVRNTLTSAELEPGLKVVIALPPDPGIAALASVAPNVQFLTINIPDVTAGGNISVLGNNSQSDISAFLAGYTAALITDDYRIGMMIPKDNADAIRALNAFASGMTFYCGICRPFYYQPWSYPQYIEIPADEDQANYDAYADILILQYKVRTIYLHPDIAIPELATYIGVTGTSMIGTVLPEERPAGWVMTIQPDVIKAIQNAWPELINGQGGITVQSPLGLGDIDPSLLSPGKQRLVEKTLSDLQAGFVSP